MDGALAAGKLKADIQYDDLVHLRSCLSKNIILQAAGEACETVGIRRVCFTLKKRELALPFDLPDLVRIPVSLPFSCFSALGASLGFVLKPFFFVESLFAFAENEFRVAIFAS
jgi:hypothetical protein